MLVVFSELFTQQELRKILAQSWVDIQIYEVKVKDLTFEQLTELGIHLLHLEGIYEATGNPLAVDSIRILVKRASDRNLSIL